MSETRRRSSDRFENKNALARIGRQPTHIINTPFGLEVLTGDYDLLEQFAEFLAGKMEDKPHPPPKFLRKLVREADPRVLALAGLAQLLDAIFRGLDPEDRSWEAKLKLKVGEDLYRRLEQPRGNYLFKWSVKQRLHAGNWLITQAMGLDFFSHDANGLPCIADKVDVAKLREALIAADPSFAPMLKPPPPWTSWSKTYDDGFRATFVRDWRPETKVAISAALSNPDWEHARGVNALSQVPLKIDPVMVKLVDRFAVKLMGNAGKQRIADKARVKIDVEDAKYCLDRTFWLDYSCDRRGRIYALQHLNFAREDHVRSLFRFRNGMKLNGDTKWLENHCAKCEGTTEKKSFDDRIRWVDEHRQVIRDIANDPFGTFGKWKGAEEAPFSYVAACRELVAAWDDPNFETTLPIGFDGSANGIQHLSLLSGDFYAAGMVNLWSDELLLANDCPSDVYTTLIERTTELIEADRSDRAEWWRERFRMLDDEKKKRKLLKQPGMTFSYAVTLGGATDQIADAYFKLKQNAKPGRDSFRYLAKKVLEACKDELPGPERVMNYIKDIAKHRTKQGRFLEWTSPSGFPVENRYQKPNNIFVECRSGSVRTRHKIADGVTDKIKKKKALNSAAPNFVHSLDAAHLVKVVNAAVRSNIADILTIHDCFYCLAPQADRFHQIILDELYYLYRDNDPLEDLRSRNGYTRPIPPKGTPVKWGDGETAEIVFDLEGVRQAKNAFI
jgi:DNA-directed RNA polymerase